MKKEYIKPSMKAIEMKVETVILAGSGKDSIGWDSAAESTGVGLSDFENGNEDNNSTDIELL